MERIAVIGSGAYGSYLIDAYVKKRPDVEITLFEVGDEHLKDEDQIGYKTNILKQNYTATKKGRFFGYGGATNKWGGAILIYGPNDFGYEIPRFQKEIVDLNIKYKSTVYEKFGFKDKYPDKKFDEGLFGKTGIWLSYFRRNLYKHFRIGKMRQVKLMPNSRVVKLNIDGNGHVTSLEYLNDGERKTASFDKYFLTAGAFESHRILLNSGVCLNNDTFRFSDHISQRVFRIYGSTVIDGFDFAYRLKGASFITNRLIGDADGYSFFAGPVFNQDFPFFDNLKKLMFKGQVNLKTIFAILKDIPSCIKLGWNALIRKRLYVYGGKWELNIDCENPVGNNCIKLSHEKDGYGENALDLLFEIDEKSSHMFNTAKAKVKQFLDKNHVKYEELSSSIEVEKAEDAYHPFGMFLDCESVADYYNKFDNMLVINTGVLPHAGGINSTAAMFPVIEEYINTLK